MKLHIRSITENRYEGGDVGMDKTKKREKHE